MKALIMERQILLLIHSLIFSSIQAMKSDHLFLKKRKNLLMKVILKTSEESFTNFRILFHMKDIDPFPVIYLMVRRQIFMSLILNEIR